jgi:hypothetical protein
MCAFRYGLHFPSLVETGFTNTFRLQRVCSGDSGLLPPFEERLVAYDLSIFIGIMLSFYVVGTGLEEPSNTTQYLCQGRPRWSSGAGSNPAENDGYLRVIKIRSTISFGGEVKSSVPCRGFTACKRTLRA